MELSCACVCFFYTTIRCFLLVFYSARGSVCARICKDEGVWLVSLARPKWHDVNAFQIGLQKSTPVIVVTQKMMHLQGIK